MAVHGAPLLPLLCRTIAMYIYMYVASTITISSSSSSSTTSSVMHSVIVLLVG